MQKLISLVSSQRQNSLRAFVFVASVTVCCFGFADRLIFIPTGKKTLKNKIFIEWIGGQDKRFQNQWFVGTGLGDSFDMELQYEDGRGIRRGLTGSFAYNYIVPVTDITPGISVGVRDIANRTSFGRYLYLAATFRLASEGLWTSDAPTEFTIGFGTQPLRGAFMGIVVPFAEQIRLLAEHDSVNLTAGLELKPIPGFGLRWLYRQNRNLIGLSWTVKL